MLNSCPIKFLCCCLALPLLFTACAEKQSDNSMQERGPQVVKVVVEPVQLSRERTHIEAVGTSRATRSITLFPATSGEVVGLHFSAGQFVQEGDLLLELDQREEKLNVELAKVRFDEAKRLYERYQRSAASGATLPTTLDAAKATLDAARIEFERTKVALDDRSVRAPFAGFVGITDVDIGDRIQTNTPISSLDDRRSLLVNFEVPEVLIGRLKVGDPVNVATWSAAAGGASGEVINIDSRINPQTRTFVLQARVDNSADLLRPGMSFRVALNIDGEPYPILPEIALQWGADGSFVWTIENKRAVRVPVNIIQRQRGQVLVNSKLEPGELVIVEGIQRMRPGIEVEVVAGGTEDAPERAPSTSIDVPGPG